MTNQYRKQRTPADWEIKLFYIISEKNIKTTLCSLLIRLQRKNFTVEIISRWNQEPETLKDHFKLTKYNWPGKEVRFVKNKATQSIKSKQNLVRSKCCWQFLEQVETDLISHHPYQSAQQNPSQSGRVSIRVQNTVIKTVFGMKMHPP